MERTLEQGIQALLDTSRSLPTSAPPLPAPE